MPVSKGAYEVSKVVAKPEGAYDVWLEKIVAFRTMQTKGTMIETNGRKAIDPETAWEAEEIKFGFYLNSGDVLRDAEGEPVLDNDGNTTPHYFIINFVSFNNRGKNFINVLKALNPPGLVVKEVKTQYGTLLDVGENEFNVDFGTNGYGQNFAGAEYSDLPMWLPKDKGGQDLSLKKIEVPCTVFEVNGVPLMGRYVIAPVTINAQGFNKVGVPLKSNKPPRDTVNVAGMVAISDKGTPVKPPAKPAQASNPTPTPRPPVESSTDVSRAKQDPAYNQVEVAGTVYNREQIRAQAAKQIAKLPFATDEIKLGQYLTGITVIGDFTEDGYQPLRLDDDRLSAQMYLKILKVTAGNIKQGNYDAAFEAFEFMRQAEEAAYEEEAAKTIIPDDEPSPVDIDTETPDIDPADIDLDAMFENDDLFEEDDLPF